MSAVVGVAVAGVDGDSAESTAWERDDRASMGGRVGACTGGGERAGNPGVLSLSGECPRFPGRPLAKDACELPKPPNDPNDPDSRFDRLPRLFWLASVLLDPVD